MEMRSGISVCDYFCAFFFFGNENVLYLVSHVAEIISVLEKKKFDSIFAPESCVISRGVEWEPHADAEITAWMMGYISEEAKKDFALYRQPLSLSLSIPSFYLAINVYHVYCQWLHGKFIAGFTIKSTDCSG